MQSFIHCFYLDQVHFILAELCMGGMVLETNMTEILTRIEEQNKLEKSEVGPLPCGLVLVSGVHAVSSVHAPCKRLCAMSCVSGLLTSADRLWQSKQLPLCIRKCGVL